MNIIITPLPADDYMSEKFSKWILLMFFCKKEKKNTV